MQLTYDDAAEEFRSEIRSWLADNLPAGWVGAAGRGESLEMSEEERATFNEEWPAKLYAGGWICATWPEEYGGKGLSTLQGVVLAEEFGRVRAPLRADFFGDTLVGPTILQWGTDEQKQEFLPKILRGESRWCQGFSEPNSGSDLASLTTTATLDGDEWVINGQKVWTTGGHQADYCFLLTRTDPDAPKHQGISYLLVPMRQDGIEVRGIRQPDGTAEFCEVFFTDARCPLDNVVGGVNNGWKVANSTLTFERGQSATTGFRRFDDEYRMMVAVATENGSLGDPLIRQRLMRYYTSVQIMRINGLRTLSTHLAERDPGRAGPTDASDRAPARERPQRAAWPGSDIAALGALNKMFWSEAHQRAMELALDIYGAAAMLVDTGARSGRSPGDSSGSWPGALRGERKHDYPVSSMMSAFFFSRSETIWGGTSQIQRNIVSERVLGLPKEPTPNPA